MAIDWEKGDTIAPEEAMGTAVLLACQNRVTFSVVLPQECPSAASFLSEQIGFESSPDREDPDEQSKVQPKSRNDHNGIAV